MPEDINHLDFTPGDEPEDENEDETEEELDDAEEYAADPATVAHLDQEGAAFADEQEAFFHVYGFRHDCRCTADYAEGKLAEVTQCFLGLSADALDTLAQMNYENKILKSMVNQMVAINTGLMDKMTALGHEDELREYMNAEHEMPQEDQKSLESDDSEGWENEGGLPA